MQGNHHACFQKLLSLQRDAGKFQQIIMICLKINPSLQSAPYDYLQNWKMEL